MILGKDRTLLFRHDLSMDAVFVTGNESIATILGEYADRPKHIKWITEYPSTDH